MPQLNMLSYFPTCDISFTEAWQEVYPIATGVPLKPAWWGDTWEQCHPVPGCLMMPSEYTGAWSRCDMVQAIWMEHTSTIHVGSPSGTHPKCRKSSYPRLGFPDHGLYMPKGLMMVTLTSLFHRRLPVHCMPHPFPQNPRDICRVQVSINPCEGWRTLCPHPPLEALESFLRKVPALY